MEDSTLLKLSELFDRLRKLSAATYSRYQTNSKEVHFNFEAKNTERDWEEFVKVIEGMAQWITEHCKIEGEC